MKRAGRFLPSEGEGWRRMEKSNVGEIVQEKFIIPNLAKECRIKYNNMNGRRVSAACGSAQGGRRPDRRMGIWILY